jgi:hypothetical protein
MIPIPPTIEHDESLCGLMPCRRCQAADERRFVREQLRSQRRRRRRDTLPAARELARLFRLHPRRFRRALTDLIESEVIRILADQLPEAIEFLVANREVSRNGQAAPGR